ncbi:hypothetical protein K491DRAFT_712321 [Lophiostoma macrostomum CBS 122681]|uniref:Uncharacterized protein n=1 Tax=Lophiostoma macrostomum CBS 122681 TaxID=1314788 RepID=A0A6A6TIC8_9PLEO|nr:hypothetical protein K491DRAFT_712321 [Lophiostoma macrostomum CBS 122681]
MDTFITGDPPPPNGNLVTIRLRPNPKSSFKDGETLTMRSNPLTATSQFFLHDLHRNWASHSLELIWPDPVAVDSYFRWAQDRIVHRFPRLAPAPRQADASTGGPAGNDKYADEASTIEKGVTEDYDTLLRLNMLGHRLWDSVFQDITISMLEESVRVPGRDVELLFRALTPALVGFVYTHSERTTNVRRFLVDTIARYASRERVEGFVMKPLGVYHQVFVADLGERLVRSAPLHVVGKEKEDGGVVGDQRLIRVLLPPPPYSEGVIGVEAESIMPLYPKVPHDPALLSGCQLQRLAEWVMGQEVDVCRYHYHDDEGKCWLAWLG